MHERRGLFPDRGGHARVAVPEVADGDSGGEVEIFAAVGVPKARAFTSHEENLRCIGGHHVLPVPFDGGLIKVFHDYRLLSFGKHSPEFM